MDQRRDFKNAARLLMLPAMRANTGDFDHRTFRRESSRATGGFERVGCRTAWRFSDRAALFANQEHDRIVAGVTMHASDE
jgi:hypothetical protein